MVQTKEEDKMKRCKYCTHELPDDYEGDVCPICEDALLDVTLKND